MTHPFRCRTEQKLVRANAELGTRVGKRTAELELANREFEASSRIRHGVGHMSELAEGLLALARLSRSSLRAEPVDLARMARDAIARCREREPRRRVDVDIAASLPATGDARLLAQVMENLLGNAWKFTLGTKHARIEVGSMAGPHDVRDSGAGLDMAYAAKLFEPFQRLHSQDELGLE